MSDLQGLKLRTFRASTLRVPVAGGYWDIGHTAKDRKDGELEVGDQRIASFRPARPGSKATLRRRCLVAIRQVPAPLSAIRSVGCRPSQKS